MDPFALYGAGATVAQGAVALIVRDPTVFAAGGIIENLLDGVGFVASAAAGRPLLAMLMRPLRRVYGTTLLPAVTDGALRGLTVLWGLLFLARAGGLYVALIHLPLASFVAISAAAGWPVTAGAAVASLTYLRGLAPTDCEPAVTRVHSQQGCAECPVTSLIPRLCGAA